ncbi:MAG: tetratricopeptide repeat protein [Acidobacteriota bacterium]|nr:tetratricopeptide repeat protein [Acidobacteriota bacterium]
MKSLQKEISRSLIEALDREVRNRGHGAITRLEQALGQSTGWWRYHAEVGNLDLHRFLVALDHLGLDPVLFIRRHLDSPDGLELDQPRGPAPKIVETSWQRLCSEDDGPGLGQAFLDRVDQQRYHEPTKALEVLQTMVSFASLDELPRLLAITGAALRAQMDFAGAEHGYYAAIQGAQLRRDQRGVGNFLRWYSYILLERGQWEEALRVTERATAILAREGDSLGLAKACFEQGQCLYYLDRLPEALQAFQAALDRLPEHEAQYRSSAFQFCGLVHRDSGQLQKAVGCLDAANSYSDSLSPKLNAKLTWFRASILGELQDWEQEERLLGKTIQTLQRTHYGEAALATCDLVRNLLIQDRPMEAFEVATSMRQLVEPLSSNRLVSAAIAELLRSGREGLTLALVQKVQSQMQSERQKKASWYQLRVEAEY